MRKSSFLAILLAIAVCGSAWAGSTATVYVHVNDYLSGRNRPDKHSTLEARFYPGEELEILEIDPAGWAMVSGGEPGTVWCSIDYLLAYRIDEDAPSYVIASDGRVRVRSEARAEGKVRGYVRNGDPVDVRFIFDGWAYLGRDVDGVQNWIDAEYLQEVTENAD